MDNKQFERVINVLGQEKLSELQKAKVMIIGLGGVGSYAVESVGRSGVGNLVLVDYDNVEYSNLNRQIEALHSTIGKPKPESLKERMLDINPGASVKTYNLKVNEENLDLLFEEKPDYVIDAIDDMNAKIALWKRCQETETPYIASLGMARRMDPTKLTVTTLNKTTSDPMARKLRYLAKMAGLNLNIPVVWSSEEPLPLSENGVLGSMIFVPATAGLICGSECIKRLAGKEK